MNNDTSSSGPASATAADAEDRLRRAYAMLDAADPARGAAVRWCERARHLYRRDGGGHVEDARRVLRDALLCGAHPPTVYRAWIALEEQHAADEAAIVVRTLLEEWGARYGGGCDDDAECGANKAELSLPAGRGGGDRARTVLGRARVMVSMVREDAGAVWEWVTEEVRKAYKRSSRRTSFVSGLFVPFGGRWSSSRHRARHGVYERLISVEP